MNISPPIPADIKALTSLRFVAAMAVVFFHFREHMGVNIDAYTQAMKTGHLAVDFFFMLSGFIMAHVYGAAVADKSFSFLKYMKKRFARIYPVHIVTLCLFVILGLLFKLLGLEPNISEKYDLAAIPSNLLMVHAWGFNDFNTFNTPSWSISAEWFAYLWFFPLALAMYALRKVPLAAYALSVAIFLGFYYITPDFTGKQITGLASDFGILRIIPEFILGMTSYAVCKSYGLGARLAKVSAIICLLGLAVFSHFALHDFIYIALFSLILILCTQSARYVQKGILSTDVFVFLGKISYSLYMTHALIYTVFFNGTEMLFGADMDVAMKLGLWFIAVCGSIPLAIIFYFLIEEPGRNFINKRFVYKNKKST